MVHDSTFYTTNLETYKAEVSSLYKKLTALSTARLLVFIATGIAVYFTFGMWQVSAGVAILGLAIFLFLLNKHSNLKTQHHLKKALVAINKNELKIASGDFFDKKEGAAFQDTNHQYSLDIDLFGRGSFFQFIDRTSTPDGALTLANALKANVITDITNRQDAVEELSEKAHWRQHFQATAQLIKTETELSTIKHWLHSQQSFLPKIMRWLPKAFLLASLIIFGLAFTGVIGIQFIGYWLFAGLIVTGKYLKKINVLASKADKIRDTFRQYSVLLKAIESETFTSDLLQQKQRQIRLKDEKASAILNSFSKSLDALDNRNNLISAIFGNGYFITDIKNSYAIESWLENYKGLVDDWFEVVSFFDAYNSLGNYAFNHSGFVFPEIVSEERTTKVANLGHPMLDAKKRVDNTFEITNEQFFIITGANMAGKSTFLRTVSLHIVMANMGLPVCAESSRYVPVKLITSMRTSDSLTDDSSYFFSELTRLKYIVDAIETDKYFIILDEILKGTNSTDKAIGSRKFVEKLVASNATGIIATHDLSLCEIEKTLPEVKNYYFDAQIINDELYFDYTFKKGICQNMNASFLLKKMEIV
ncbi:DNA mismatch repair protein MutS [Bizionia gelidisalsuginis]|uniref:DNA mismatch repair protein MutS n=1 Tax=Bizionia gelidisalsuginis TaxID=291188 RepID=A0ABY3M981_9FLAO|nr:DNA mismatch repair protein MutS [Bizionia gelidisalsuginis]TYC11302.1 DNA mismatch repair protein MutS [Bizionia gelidisalsuginis]